MAGQKRTRNGAPKPSNETQPQPQPQPHQQNTPTTNTPPCGQAPTASSKTTDPDPDTKTARTATARPRNRNHNHNPPPSTKRPPLPATAILTKRPLLHPAIPTPFSASHSPKILYITASSPFIPTCKRVRALLAQISKRAAQSTAAVAGGHRRRGNPGLAKGRPEANGRLEARDVEAGIVDAAAAAAAGRGKGRRGAGQGGREGGEGGEQVYLKATGRAIPRALELGVKFQGEDDCVVRVEMGNVRAIDDVEVRGGGGGGGGEGGEGEGEGEGQDEEEEQEEVPETRIRTLSTVTVCIGLR